MKNFYHSARTLLTIICVLVFLAVTACAQTTLTRRCPGAAPSPGYAKIDLLNSGDINLVPCATKNVLLNGVTFAGSGLTLNGLSGTSQTFAVAGNDTASVNSTGTAHTFNFPITGITGASRSTFLPFFDGQNTLAKSTVSWNGTQYLFDNATANATFRLKMTPASGAGYFEVGSLTTAIQLNQTTGQFAVTSTRTDIASSTGAINLFSGQAMNIDTVAGVNITGGAVEIGASGLSINGSTRTNGNLVVNSDWQLSKAITAAGTTGNITSNNLSGTVNVAAGNNSVVVANNRVSATSIIMGVARTNDATCSVKSIVPSAGLFTLNLTANCTSETAFAFLVTN